MREISTFRNEDAARMFSDLLLVNGIGNRVLDDEDGSWSIWVQDDDQLEEAGELLREFNENPDRPEFGDYSKQAEKIRFEERKEQEKYIKRVRASQIQWRYSAYQGIGRVTFVMILASIAVAVISRLGSDTEIIGGLFITDYEITGNMIRWYPGLPDIFTGEVWRLVTPIFIHFGFLHILFNMLWLKDLGTQIEFKQSSVYFVFLVLVIAAGSNLAQYAVSGPSFGGMSGVVYGLLGYIWIRGKHDPSSGLFLQRNIVIFMIAWFFICLVGLVGNVANVAHGAGLVIGMAWGYISAIHIKKLRRS